MESNSQSENDVGVEDRADEEQSNGSFDNDEYNSSVGEIDEEISDTEEGTEFDGELDMSSTDENESEQEDCDAEKINITCMGDILKIDMNNISV
ncbi:hypothetical protein A2U01_0034067, partial [Trifolium medium]|nr:hypothetical protein [Trifolium medium]